MSTWPEQINQQYDDENKSLTSEMAQDFYNKINEYTLYTTVLNDSFDQNLNNTQKEQIQSASIAYIVQQFHSLWELQKACASEDKNLWV